MRPDTCRACMHPTHDVHAHVADACNGCVEEATDRLVNAGMPVDEDTLPRELDAIGADAREVDAFHREHGATIRRLGAEHGRVAS